MKLKEATPPLKVANEILEQKEEPTIAKSPDIDPWREIPDHLRFPKILSSKRTH